MPKTGFQSLLPVTGITPREQLNDCLSALGDIINTNTHHHKGILKQSVFLRTCSNDDFERKKKELDPILKDYYGTSLPPTSFIGQPPEEKKQVALELLVLTDASERIEIERKTLSGMTYSVVRHGDHKEIYAAGLTTDNIQQPTAVQAREVFSQMSQILAEEGLNFSDVVRQWNYIEDIVGSVPDEDSEIQNYQQFNDIRSFFYETDRFQNGYPSATGIGMNAGGVIVEFIAVSTHEDILILPLSNPRQVDAHQYSDDVLIGDSHEVTPRKSTPKFERGKLVSFPLGGRIYIAGTAAILGQKTAPEKDVESQTKTTIENILALVSRENVNRCGFRGDIRSPSPTYIRVYVKEESEIPRVKHVCKDYFGDVPSLFLVSDICRKDLLVEIEGVLDFF